MTTEETNSADNGNWAPWRWEVLGIIAVLLWSAFLRYYALRQAGFRFCDEGYTLLYPHFVAFSPELTNVIFQKHGLTLLLSKVVRVFGPEPNVALIFSATCGVATVGCFYFIVRAIYGRGVALPATFMFGTCRYILFYHRSNLGEGYGMFFLSLTVLFFVYALGLHRKDDDVARRPIQMRGWGLLVFVGVLLGFTFTVRLLAFVVLVGTIGALGCCLAWRQLHGRLAPRRFGTYAVYVAMWFGTAALVYLSVVWYLGDLVDWERTRFWYGKYLRVTNSGGQAPAWQPYLFVYIAKFASPAFWLLAGGGVIAEIFRLRKTAGLARLWVMVCCLGLGAFLLKAALPWPRAYAYSVFFLCIYWGVGAHAMLSWQRLRYEFRWLAVVGVAVAAMLLEVNSAHDVFSQPDGYKAVNSYIVNAERAHQRDRGFIAPPSWPIVALAYGKGAHIVYDIERGADYREFCRKLLVLHQQEDVRFMYVDLNITYLATPPQNQLLQRFALANPPAMVAQNDIANDHQAVADAFLGRRQRHDLFSQRIIVYDLQTLAPLLARELEPPPFTDDEDMNRRFEKLLEMAQSR